MAFKESPLSRDKQVVRQRMPQPPERSLVSAAARKHPADIVQRAKRAPGSLSESDVLQLQRAVGNQSVGRFLAATAQRRTEQTQAASQPARSERNETGLPDGIKTGVENLSGIALDDVKVHYNSSKPAQVQALAYTQGAEIHIGPGQESHLPHEAWHVVQQKQGRVQPTMQLKGVSINDDSALEREADVMGARATSYRGARESRASLQSAPATLQRRSAPAHSPIQCVTLYRGMRASTAGGASPILDNTAFGLGVRDSDVTEGKGYVTAGGMSTSNTSIGVPNFTISSSYGGGSHGTTDTKKDAFRWKWSFDTDNLPSTLTSVNDHNSHVLIKPSNLTTSLVDFRTAVQGTQANWARIDP